MNGSCDSLSNQSAVIVAAGGAKERGRHPYGPRSGLPTERLEPGAPAGPLAVSQDPQAASSLMMRLSAAASGTLTTGW
jgi:hypothetical protein